LKFCGKDRLNTTKLPNRSHQGPAVGLGKGCLSCRIDFRKNEAVRLTKNFYKVIKKITGAAEPVGLKDKKNASSRISATNRLQGGPNLCRVMTIVINELGLTMCKAQATPGLKPPAHTTELA
jgi:hypothetical protein